MSFKNLGHLSHVTDFLDVSSLTTTAIACSAGSSLRDFRHTQKKWPPPHLAFQSLTRTGFILASCFF